MQAHTERAGGVGVGQRARAIFVWLLGNPTLCCFAHYRSLSLSPHYLEWSTEIPCAPAHKVLRISVGTVFLKHASSLLHTNYRISRESLMAGPLLARARALTVVPLCHAHAHFLPSLCAHC
jgi:hypothetical protein